MTKFYFDKDVWVARLGITFLYILLFLYLFSGIIKDNNPFSLVNISVMLIFIIIIFWIIYISFIQRYYFYPDKIIVKKLFTKRNYLISELSNIQIIDQKDKTKYFPGKTTYYSYTERSDDLHIKNKFVYKKYILLQFNDTNNPKKNTYISPTSAITKNYLVLEYRRDLDFYLYLYEEKLKERHLA